MNFNLLQGERATGYGVALLNTLFGQYSKSALLREICPANEANGNAANNGDGNTRSKRARTK